MSSKMSKMDRTAVRRPTELEQKYAFEKQFNENRALAEQAQSASVEAVRIASEISQTDKGLSLKVEALDNELNGEGGVKAELNLRVKTDTNGNLESAVHAKGDKFTVESKNFNLDEKGNVSITGHIEATSGRIGGCDIDENGNLQLKNANIAEKLTADKINADGISAKDVNVSGTFETAVNGSTTTITGGTIHVDCAKEAEVIENGVVVTEIKHRVLTFTGWDKKDTYAIYVKGIKDKQTGVFSYSPNLVVEKVE